MSTQKQTEANRLNAQHSTGPRTAAGRARSSMNALKSGLHAQSLILPGENRAELETLIAEYHDYHQPVSPETRALCDKLAHNEWLSHRMSKIERQVLDWEIGMLSRPQTDCLLGQAYIRCSYHLSRIERRSESLDREYHRDLKMLRLLEAEQAEQAETAACSPEPDPQAQDVPPPEVVPPPQPDPAPPASPTPHPPISTSQPAPSTIQTPKMASFRQGPMRPGHPELLQDCPNCRNLGYLNSNCHYVSKKNLAL